MNPVIEMSVNPTPRARTAPPVPAGRPRFYIETFGCQMNAADSEEMSRTLRRRGFIAADSPADADLFIINTCTVRQHAENRALSFLGRLRRWKDERPGRLLVVAGCVAERLKKELPSRFSHLDGVVGAKSMDRFDTLVEKLLLPAEGPARLPDPGRAQVTAHVTVMRGCNFSCSYCIVPSVRGRESHRPLKNILEEIREKTAEGTPEVLLLGQTVNSYRGDGPAGTADFADLLRAVQKIDAVRRIRYMSPHPFYVNDRFLAALAECDKVCPHIHLPLQSGSDRLLKRMRRNHTRADFLDRVRRLRRARPEILITTDLIAGFPGETDDDFNQTVSLVRESAVDGAFCFKYSPRPGTPAAEFPDDVPETVKEERHAELLKIVTAHSERGIASLVNTRQDILIEDVKSPGRDRTGRIVPVYEGRTRTCWKTFFTSSRNHRRGDIVPVQIAEAVGRNLWGDTRD
ncbi:MAG TPA: tRNA (N6-isopentenyl adenosine(37)-C2)-methylthiotransferase MiaB [Elusimicrobiota bacterium]|nr:tRNA (N6-isopentenyl adenosine(37)-C2)-methylthiotransferase MiaB [Elusimicrobiota bacterium]